MLKSEDIQFETNDGIYYFRYLPWDTKFFGKSAYLLDLGCAQFQYSDGLKKFFQEKMQNSFVTVKIGSDHSSKETIWSFQELGFRYIDTEVELKYQITSPSSVSVNKNLIMNELNHNHDLPYEDIGAVFTYTRFHSDINIPRETADAFWADYFKNYQPSSQKHIFVAEYKNDLAGVILVNENESRSKATLFLVAVMEKYRNQKIGSQLIAFVSERYKGYDVGTEVYARNIGAINFYIRNGFSEVASTRIVFHRWS